MDLPPGKKPLRDIEQQSNAASRVIDLTILLDFALASLDPSPNEDRNASPSDRIKRNATRFTSLPDMMFAIGVRNDLVHATNASRKNPGQGEIKRAAKILRRGLIEVIPALHVEVAEAIVRGSHVDPQRGKSATPAKAKPQRLPAKRPPQPARDRKTILIVVASLLALLVLPPLVRRLLHGSESAAEPMRQAARAGRDHFLPYSHVPGFEAEYDAVEKKVQSGDHFWNELDYRAARDRYADARDHLVELESLERDRDAAAKRRAEAEAAKNAAISERAAVHAKSAWSRGGDELETATHEFEKGASSFGGPRFVHARELLDEAAREAKQRRASRAAEQLATAEAANARGEVAKALELYFDAAREGNTIARERFDSLARTCPEFWTSFAQKLLYGEPNIEIPDRLRAMLALAERDAKSPPELAAPRLLLDAYRQSLRYPDPRTASDFLLSIARAQRRLDPSADVPATLKAASEALEVTLKDPEIVLRSAQLAAITESISGSSGSRDLLKEALDAVASSKELSTLAEAIYLAELHRFDEALSKAIGLLHDPVFRESGEIALSFVAWRAAEVGNAEVCRKARLAATESGIEGSTPRGGVALFQFTEADLALDRIEDADATRRKISYEKMRAAADYSLAEARARHDQIGEARTLFDAIVHTESPFGAGAAAEIAAARLRNRDESPFAVADWALALHHDDLKAAALGGAAQEIARAAAPSER